MKQRSLLWRKIKNHLLNFFSILAIVFAISVMLWVICVVISYGKDALTPSLFVNCSAPYGSMTYGIGNAIVGTLLMTPLIGSIRLMNVGNKKKVYVKLIVNCSIGWENLWD